MHSTSTLGTCQVDRATAFAGYSFHVAEAALVFANEVLVCFLFPIHAGLHRAYHLFTTVIHNGGHAGYEIAPFIPSLEAVLVLALRALDPRWDLSRGLNTVLHHDMHHRFPTRHFSLYFTHWDRWCGSEHPDYALKVAAFSCPTNGEVLPHQEVCGSERGDDVAVGRQAKLVVHQ